MAVYGIADLHLDPIGDKPMDIFGENWVDHEKKIFNHWNKVISDDDLVLIPGDISWALKLDEAKVDLTKIDELPGIKVIGKGNHDYWWGTKSKLNSLKLNSIHFLYNDHFIYKDIAICGTRGWPSKDSEEFDPHDEKVFNREVNRLELSLNSVCKQVNKIIVMLHYPPFNIDKTPNEFVEVMKKYNVEVCVYGHLHSEGHKFAVEGKIDGIDFHCISCDYINFKLKKIM
ncbi:metallophosphoesterase [Thermohalobacter berrensis]|uniref:Serine/threonine protein phosphatase n=1 Tax=Thermohalobacter berrensis TaxID=99594 RepID=A0A419SZ74_9FIRM|nr:metallophosphoesterase [Thermohalobacter berrensis]RKD30560.1 serine/threonine protein phosphatase [Thermohalobacter berrensis]